MSKANATKTVKPTFSCGVAGCTKKHTSRDYADNCRRFLLREAERQAQRQADFEAREARFGSVW